jgi:hypothetical protein
MRRKIKDAAEMGGIGRNDSAPRGLLKPPDKNHRPFFERRVPGVAPWRALNFGFDLQIT